MIFQHTHEKVMSGKKWQTRRRVKPGERLAITTSYAEIQSASGRRKYRTGETYAVQPGRGQAQIGRIRITDIRQEDVREIHPADVRAEGFETRAEFMDVWNGMHGDNYRAWVIEFELCDAWLVFNENREMVKQFNGNDRELAHTYIEENANDGLYWSNSGELGEYYFYTRTGTWLMVNYHPDDSPLLPCVSKYTAEVIREVTE